MPAQMYLVADGLPGRLWIMPRPQSETLPQQMMACREAGMDHLVSMLEPEEAIQLGLAEEARHCAVAGMSFHTHPITDFGLPELPSFTALTRQIHGWLAQGQGVGVHCRGGIGRSGMVTAGVLMVKGQSARDAITTVSVARGSTIPDTVEQGNFLSSFEKCVSS